MHAPWALAINARLRERYGVDGQAVASDDGIVIRIPDTDAEAPGGDVIVFDAEEIEDLVTGEVGGSALFASRFRECAARALLLPRRDPGRRSPLWQQRQRSAALLEVASKYPSFPIVLEAVRECLQDVYDLPALVALMRGIGRREVQVVDVATQSPSPFARTLLFGYVAQFVYEGDSPIAERRAAALSLDQGLLAELLGRAELRELLDPDVLAEVEAEVQRLAPDRRARDAEGVADLLRMLGPLSTEEVSARSVDGADVAEWLDQLTAVRRVVEVRMAGEERWSAIEDIGRLRDGLGVPVPPGTPDAFTDPVEDPLADLVSRFARTHGPFTTDQVADRLGLGAAVVRHTLQRLAASGRVLDGEFRPAGSGSEWCDAEVLRRLRRRSLARLRKEVEPVEPEALGRFLAAWQHVGPAQAARRPARGRRGADRDRPARRLLGPGVRPRAPGARRPGARLRAVVPRRADGLRRGAVGRARGAARGGRMGLPAPGRPGPPHAARSGALRAQRAPPGRPRRPRPRWGVVLPPARRRGLLRRRPDARGRAVGARLGRPGQQRHADPAARADPGRQARAPQPPAPAAPADGLHHRAGPDAGTHRASRDARAAGPCCPRSTPTPRGGRTPPPSTCSTGTGSSSAAPS